MERTCQASYPLNSENASPPGTFRVYLSWTAWADTALPPKALTSAVTIAIVHMRLLFITGSSFVKQEYGTGSSGGPGPLTARTPPTLSAPAPADEQTAAHLADSRETARTRRAMAN